jgi:phenylacetate-coenzyme A ligase PaaK-like adenylate-forming protein
MTNPIYQPTAAPLTAADVERIAAQVARRTVQQHEARGTIAGVVAVVAIVLGLVATGRF